MCHVLVPHFGDTVAARFFPRTAKVSTVVVLMCLLPMVSFAVPQIRLTLPHVWFGAPAIRKTAHLEFSLYAAIGKRQVAKRSARWRDLRLHFADTPQ